MSGVDKEGHRFFGRAKSWIRSTLGLEDAKKTPPPPAPAQDPDAVFSKHFRNKLQGHGRPTPRFGAPAIIWHIGLAPKRYKDPTHTEIKYQSEKTLFDEIFAEFKAKHAHLFAENSALNTFLFRLQKDGRIYTDNAEKFTLDTPDTTTIQGNEAIELLQKPFICFTLWWNKGQQTKYSKPVQQGDGPSDLAEASIERNTPSPDAIRVRVHAQALIDHVTLSFYIDPGKAWNEEPIYTLDEANGDYRKEIFTHVEKVRKFARQRLHGKHIEENLVPEKGVSEEEAEALLQANDFLYRQIWEDFCADFHFTLADMQKRDWSCFALYRGLVLSTEGLKNEKSDTPTPRETASPGASPFYRFADASIPHSERHRASSEANAVVKAFWPFIRRSTPFADEKDFIACGVMDWRAIYVTALASPQASGRMEEWDADSQTPVPAGFLPLDYPLDTTLAPALGEKKRDPIRYLFLTKYEPDPRQVGRMVERVNTLGTIRLFALKDWDVVRNADAHIRIRGQELDAVMSNWSQSCWAIQEEFLEAQEKLLKIHKKKGNLSVKWERALQDLESKRDEDLTAVTDKVEKYLIKISSSLDKIGSKAVGGLHYRIRRSAHYITEFNTLVKTLQFGNIDTWVSYDQFADRGLKPIFDFLLQSGERLAALRERLKVVLESIQTSALVVQTSATRQNTKTLKDLAWTARYSGYGVIGLILAWIGRLIVNHFGGLAHYWDTFKHLLPF